MTLILNPVNQQHHMDGIATFNVSPKVKNRCRWTLEALKDGQKLRKEDVGRNLNCSEKTAQRSLDVLRNAGLISFEGPKKTGFYVLI